MVYKTTIKDNPRFVESNKYTGYLDRVLEVVYKSTKKTSIILIPLTVLVMRDEETWAHKQNYIVAYEVGNKNF